MRIIFASPTPEKLAQLENAARLNPGRYRAILHLLAFIGDALLMLIKLLPLLLIPMVLALLYPVKLFFWLIGIAAVFFIWIFRTGITDQGFEISRDEMPELFEEIDRLKAATDVTGNIAVRLTDEINARAYEQRGLFGLIGTRRTLTLGIPMLAALDVNEARAVIGHELGHFSRRHGRFGHSLYWAHMGWLDYASATDRDSMIIERSGAAFARLFVPMFSRRAMVWSRACEYEADADAARLAGAENLVSGLVRFEVLYHWLEHEWPPLLRSYQRGEEFPPDDLLNRLQAGFAIASPKLAEAVIQKGRSEKVDWADTHPSMSKRAEALSTPVRLQPLKHIAGSAMLGAAWADVAAGYNSRLRASLVVPWVVAHVYFKEFEAALLQKQLDDPAALSARQRLACALSHAKIDPVKGRAELKALLLEFPEDNWIGFEAATTFLDDDDPVGVDRMLAIAKSDPGYRLPVAAALSGYFGRNGPFSEKEKWSRQHEACADEWSRARNLAVDALEDGKFERSQVDRAVAAALAAAISTEPAIAAAWLLQTSIQRQAVTRNVNAVVHILVLRLTPDANSSHLTDEDGVIDQFQNVLAGFVEPNAVPLVHTYYTTEQLPPELSAKLGQIRGASIFVRAAGEDAAASGQDTEPA